MEKQAKRSYDSVSMRKCNQVRVREHVVLKVWKNKLSYVFSVQHESVSCVSRGWKEMAQVNNLCPSKSHLSANYCKSSQISCVLFTQNLCSPNFCETLHSRVTNIGIGREIDSWVWGLIGPVNTVLTMGFVQTFS